MSRKKTITICGAGIAGVAVAYYLSQKNSDLQILLIDKNQPLSFTTSKSGENFRTYWPQQCMKEFVGRSIALMEQLQAQYGEESFDMNFSGYNFISHKKDKAIFGIQDARAFEGELEIVKDAATINDKYPFLDNQLQQLVINQKAGAIDVYQLGSLLLREAKLAGTKFLQNEIVGIQKRGNIYKLYLDRGKVVETDVVVIATGPFINQVGKMLNMEFPITNVLQRKIIIPDPKQLIPRDMPFTIYMDEQLLDWSDEERTAFEGDSTYQRLLEQFPGALHIKPEGTGIKMGWAFNTHPEEPKWETPKSELFPQIILKGASKFIPSLVIYEQNIPTPLIEYAGYYTRTKENLPLIGPTNSPDVFVVGALAGYGTMSACAAGALCADYILEETLPSYAAYFHPDRNNNPAIKKELDRLGSDGQL